MNLDFNTQQKRIVAAGLTALSAAIVVAVVVVLFYFLGRFFQIFDNVFLPLAVAGVLAMVLDPWYEWLHERMPKPLALLIIFLSIIIPLAAFAVFFGALLVNQINGLLEQLPIWWDRLVTWFQINRPNLNRFYDDSVLLSRIKEFLQNPGGPAASFGEFMLTKILTAGSSVVAGILSFLGWIIVPVYLAFFLIMPRARPDALHVDHFPFLKRDTAMDLIFLIREFFRLVVIFFRGQIVIALIQGTLLAIGFSLLGLKYGAVLGLMLGFFNIIPYLGTMIGLSICLPIAWFQIGGGLTLTLLVLGVFVLVQMIEGYYLTPKIMGTATGLNPLAIIIGVFFWGAALNGILGMILAIPLTAFFAVLWRLAREKYIGHLF